MFDLDDEFEELHEFKCDYCNRMARCRGYRDDDNQDDQYPCCDRCCDHAECVRE